MASKTSTDVIIGGKVYKLSGYESEEYLQKVASYLNAKINDITGMEGWVKLNTDYRNTLMQLNIADDYFKTQKELESAREVVASRENDLYELKHELITTQMKLETAEKNLKAIRAENDENTKKIIRLETELRAANRQNGNH